MQTDPYDIDEPGAEALAAPSQEERTWAMAAHAAAPVGLFFSGGTLGWLAPLLIWLFKRDESRFVAEQAKEALNFQITLLVINVGLWVFAAVFALPTLGLAILAAILAYGLVLVIEIVLGIVAAMKTFAGERYRYPFNWRVL